MCDGRRLWIIMNFPLYIDSEMHLVPATRSSTLILSREVRRGHSFCLECTLYDFTDSQQSMHLLKIQNITHAYEFSFNKVQINVFSSNVLSVSSLLSQEHHPARESRRSRPNLQLRPSVSPPFATAFDRSWILSFTDSFNGDFRLPSVPDPITLAAPVLPDSHLDTAFRRT